MVGNMGVTRQRHADVRCIWSVPEPSMCGAYERSYMPKAGTLQWQAAYLMSQWTTPLQWKQCSPVAMSRATPSPFPLLNAPV